MAKPKREWVDDPETAERIGWAMAEARRRVDTEPWASVVLAQVAIEVGLSFVVHVMTIRQREPALRRWIEGLSVTTLSRPEEVGLVNALLARSRERIDGDAELWEAFRRHVKRRNEFLHRGLQPSAEEAAESLNVTERFNDRLLKMAAAASDKLDMEAAARRKRREQQARREALESLAEAAPEDA